MIKYLAVDTASDHLTAVAFDGKNHGAVYEEDCATGHSVKIMGAVDSALAKLGMSASDCDFFAAVTGPGSFTGIRIGISTVKGLAMGAGKKLLGLTAFDLVAYNVKADGFYVVIDAAHSHYYAKGYKKFASKAGYLSFDEVQNLPCPKFGFQDLPLKNYTRLDVCACLPVAVEALSDSAGDDIFALYVRKSQAEEGRR